MKIVNRLFFYGLSLFYIWYMLFELPGDLEFIKHATFYQHEMGFYVYRIYTYIELIYLAMLTAWIGSTQGSFGRKFMCWFWQVVLFMYFITAIFHIFCPAVLGPGEVQTLEQSLLEVVKGIGWAVWSGWGLYHLYKYRVMPRAEKIFHIVVAVCFWSPIVWRGISMVVASAGI